LRAAVSAGRGGGNAGAAGGIPDFGPAKKTANGCAPARHQNGAKPFYAAQNLFDSDKNSIIPVKFVSPR
jgi:hypothetical protein